MEKLPPEVSDLDLPFDSVSVLMGQAPPTTSGGFLYSLASVYDEWQNQLRTASDANDIANIQLEAAYNKAVEKVKELEEQLQEKYEAQEKVLSANKDAERAVLEKLNQMSSSVTAAQADEEVKNIPDKYLENHSFGGFN